MSKVSYTANGEAKVFYFDFPFYQKDDVVVAVNHDIAAPGFAIQIGKPNPIGVFPYLGGSVRFASAPALGTKIEIWREFVMLRPCNYQSLSQPRADELNRDFNFNLENMKDFRRLLKEFMDKYANILKFIDAKELTDKISAVMAAIEAFGSVDVMDAALRELRTDFNTLAQTVQELVNNQPDDNSAVIAEMQNTISELTAQIEALQSGSQLPDSADFIIDTIVHTDHTDEAGNVCATYREDVWAKGGRDIIATGITKGNTTEAWYKITRNGWIEQGGIIPVNTSSINFIFEMESDNAPVIIGGIKAGANANPVWAHVSTNTQTKTGFTILSTGTVVRFWRAAGVMATI